MRSVKRGRGPSFNEGVGSVVVAVFGVFWTMVAANIGAGFMVPFGLLFVGLAVYQAVYNFKNATSENRYSEFDIVEDEEEVDPLNERFGKKVEYKVDGQTEYCPYCGTKVKVDFEFCPKCGRRLD